MDFVEICNVCAGKAIIEAAKRIINSDKVCHSYSDVNFGVTFFGTQCISSLNLGLNVWIILVKASTNNWPTFACQLSETGNFHCTVAVCV